jgi:hypothetical protein
MMQDIKQTERLIARYRAEYENAMDDMLYGYGYEFWRNRNNSKNAPFNSIKDEETAKRIWLAAKESMVIN